MLTPRLAHSDCGVVRDAARRVWRRVLFCACGTALAVAAAAPVTEGASFSVDPTLIRLSQAEPSQLLEVRNDSAEPVRFQVAGFAWAQSLDGEMEVAATEDLVFFPELFTLAPGQSRKIRVGTTAAYGRIEKAYRLFVEELPPEEPKPETTSGVRVLTKMGIPVFLAPTDSRAEARLSSVGLSGAEVGFTLDNAGTTFFVPEDVRVVGVDATGATVIDRKLQSWYVLAGTSRRFSMSVPPPDCDRVRAVAIEVKAGGAALKERLETPRGTCGP
jgi:fimbrial chaperone protein